VIRTRDVTFNDNLLYDPLELDIGDILKEHVDKLIETLDILEAQITEIAEDDDLLETVVEEALVALGSMKSRESLDSI
jgi:hypothetical protein